MKAKYAVTFEFDMVAPVTERGITEGSSLRTMTARSIDDATAKNPNMNWRSVSILIERMID